MLCYGDEMQEPSVKSESKQCGVEKVLQGNGRAIQERWYGFAYVNGAEYSPDK